MGSNPEVKMAQFQSVPHPAVERKQVDLELVRVHQLPVDEEMVAPHEEMVVPHGEMVVPHEEMVVPHGETALVPNAVRVVDTTEFYC